MIIEDLQKLEAGDEASRQLASLISSGPIVPVGPECIDLLGRIIQDHTDQFRREFLACRTATRSASIQTAADRP